MKVNITGKGPIPGMNSIAPIYNRELDESQIRRLLNFNNIRVFDSSTGNLITKKNISSVMNNATSITVENNSARIEPNPVVENVIEAKEDITENVTTVEEPTEVIVSFNDETPVSDDADIEVSPSDINNDDVVAEDTTVVEEQLDSTEDTVVEESIIGDKDASETSSNNVQYNNKKNRNKNKHRNNK